MPANWEQTMHRWPVIGRKLIKPPVPITTEATRFALLIRHNLWGGGGAERTE